MELYAIKISGEMLIIIPAISAHVYNEILDNR